MGVIVFTPPMGVKYSSFSHLNRWFIGDQLMPSKRLGSKFKLTMSSSYIAARKSTLCRLATKETDFKKAYSLVQRHWQKQYGRLLSHDPEFFAPGVESAKRRPFSCHPAGCSYVGLPRQCGRTSICPWCYMRQVASFYDSVISYRREHLTGVTWYLRTMPVQMTDADLDSMPGFFREMTGSREQLVRQKIKPHAALASIRVSRDKDGIYSATSNQLFTMLGENTSLTRLELSGKIQTITSARMTTKKLETLVGTVCAYPTWLQYADPASVVNYLRGVRDARFRSQVRYGGFRTKKETVHE